ncbi:hypothetical protein BSKO_08415 [Bryopsis sp. KO-2023]|nr:hypothetical protein BSKO_08415 [Bryopsis sp. KO-2023]
MTSLVFASFQPANIYEFGARYFAELIEQSQGGDRQGDALESLTEQELEELVLRLFAEADEDQSGYLDRRGISQVLLHHDLHLNARQIRSLLAEADENDEGLVNYTEFVPTVTNIIHTHKTAKPGSESKCNFLINGVSKVDFERHLGTVLKKASKGQDKMARLDFKQCLCSSELGLTRKDINLILGSLQIGKNDEVNWEEVVVNCFDVVKERHADVLETNQLPASQDVFEDILSAFSIADEGQTGVLPLQTVKQIIRAKSLDGLGLTSFQIASILSCVELGEKQEARDCTALPHPLPPSTHITSPHEFGLDGNRSISVRNDNALACLQMDYDKVARFVAEKVASLYNLEKRRLRQDAIHKLSQAEGVQQMSFASPDTVKVLLEQTFKEADTDGTGYLTVEQIKHVVEKLASAGGDKFQIPKQHLDTIFVAIDADSNGNIDYKELSDFWTHMLDHVTQENIIEEYVSQTDEG